LKRAGFAALAEKALGPACMEAADDLRVAHTLDLCRAALQHEGLDAPADREGMVRASLTTHTLTEALGAAVNKVLLDGYLESPATWRSFAGVRSVPDFKTATAIRPSFTGSLQQIPPGGEFKHGGADEATTQYKVDTYGKMFSIDRRDLINDDLSLFDSVARAMGQAAMRKLSDLVYDTLMSNAGAFFSAGNGNFITGVDTNLSTDGLTKAITAMLTQRDAEGNDLDLRPTRLVVPPELQTVARAVLESEYIAAQTNLPTGNSLRNAVGLEVEPRLSNTKKYGTKASTKHWYLFAAPAASPIIVGFLNGQQTPTVEFFGLDQTVNKLAVSWRVYFDFGAAL
ncbi:MAG: Mu-like prophage major head subunit gpT family protein, partial [Phycisphaerales bacterium]